MNILGFQVDLAENRFKLRPGPRTWTELRKALERAHGTSNPTKTANEVASGWWNSLMPETFESERERKAMLHRMQNIASGCGFPELSRHLAAIGQVVTYSRAEWNHKAASWREPSVSFSLHKAPAALRARNIAACRATASEADDPKGTSPGATRLTTSSAPALAMEPTRPPGTQPSGEDVAEASDLVAPWEDPDQSTPRKTPNKRIRQTVLLCTPRRLQCQCVAPPHRRSRVTATAIRHVDSGPVFLVRPFPTWPGFRRPRPP